jgi:hypothetical protein
MPTILEIDKDTNEGLAFDFPLGWEVVKYDQEADIVTGTPAGFYRSIISDNGVKHIRGMDIVCRLPGEPHRLQFIESKDDRKRTMEAGERHTELYETVLRKTVGTLAGLTLAERLGDDSLRPMACLSQHPAIEVVLFLIEPPLAPRPRQGDRNELRRLIKEESKATLEQRLRAKLDLWGMPFNFYNLTTRLPLLWQVRDLTTPS